MRLATGASEIAKRVRTVQGTGQRFLNLHRLSRQGDGTAQAIGRSLRSVLRPAFTPEEQAWIDRLERLRAELNASTKQIIRMDYGAGNPCSPRTAEAMRQGVEVTDTLAHLSRAVSKPPFWCTVLFQLIRTLRPKSCIEMGTAVGISTAYQAAALKLNGEGTLTTLEGAGTLAEIARTNLGQLGLDTVEIVVGRFQDTLADVLRRQQPVDYVFVDGHHDGPATVAYFEQLVPSLTGTAVLVFDDITWSAGMTRAWRTIAGDRRLGVAVDLGPVGVCAVGTPSRRTQVRIPLA
jgi:predicted O-methyltransferase YrrM